MLAENIKLKAKKLIDDMISLAPWFLDAAYWMTLQISTAIPSIQAHDILVFWFENNVQNDNTDQNRYHDVVIMTTSSQRMVLRIPFVRQFNLKAIKYFTSAICRFYNKMNGHLFDEFCRNDNETYISLIKMLHGKSITTFFKEADKTYVMPRSIRARYIFATNMAYFDFIIGGNTSKSSKRTFFRDLLSHLEERAFKTYEGKHYAFSCLVDSQLSTTGFRLLEYLKSKESNLFSNGKDNYFVVDSNGIITGYKSWDCDYMIANRNQNKQKEIFAPLHYMSLAKECSGSQIGIVLTKDGDILIFKNLALVIARIKGKWHYIDQSAFVEFITEKIMKLGDVSNDTARYLAKDIYATVLDVSFARTGGCIGIVNSKAANISEIKTSCSKVTKNVLSSFIFDSVKTRGNSDDMHVLSFGNLNRQHRMEILSLDGAAELNQNGIVSSFGYILPETIQTVESGEGGRSAAAKAFGQKGLGIKISEDGPITIYYKDTEKNPAEFKIFS